MNYAEWEKSQSKMLHAVWFQLSNIVKMTNYRNMMTMGQEGTGDKREIRAAIKDQHKKGV